MKASSNITKMVNFMALISMMRRTKIEIMSLMEEEHGYKISSRTFDRMLHDVRELGYEVKIDSNYRYYLESESRDIDYKVIVQINSLLTRKALLKKLGPDIENNFIIQNYIDGGVHNITTIIEALNRGRNLVFDYTNRESFSSYSRCVLPFKLMEAEYRWYLIAWEYKINDLRIFSLDKMGNIFLGEKFKKEDINIEILKKVRSYEKRIGVNKPLFEETPLKVFNVKIGVAREYEPFIKKLPLHNSQEFTNESSNGYQMFTIDVIPDYTLIKKISSELGSLKLAGPPELISRILQEYPWFSAFVL